MPFTAILKLALIALAMEVIVTLLNHLSDINQRFACSTKQLSMNDVMIIVH